MWETCRGVQSFRIKLKDKCTVFKARYWSQFWHNVYTSQLHIFINKRVFYYFLVQMKTILPVSFFPLWHRNKNTDPHLVGARVLTWNASFPGVKAFKVLSYWTCWTLDRQMLKDFCSLTLDYTTTTLQSGKWKSCWKDLLGHDTLQKPRRSLQLYSWNNVNKTQNF